MKREIVIENVSKFYGKRQALKNVNLQISEGMFGLLGRNGAGKTTLMRILAALLNKSGGNIKICGVPVEKASAIRSMTGYLPQDFSMYPNMKVYDAMDYLGVLSGLDSGTRKKRIKQLLEMVNLHDCYGLKVKAMSGGMRRRLGIAQAILNDPAVLIVDEPTAGLDPEERVRFRNLLCGVAAEKIVILSTHIVEDIEKTCSSIAVLNEGSISYSGSLKGFIGDFEGLEEAYMSHMGGKAI